MTTLVIPGTAEAYANFGRWVADCGWPDRCSGAAQLARLDAGFICGDCGRATEVIWPALSVVEGVETLLMMRKHPKNRNWLPGESLNDLVLENGANGVLDGLEPATPGTVLLAADDRQVSIDKVSPLLVGGRRELEGTP